MSVQYINGHLYDVSGLAGLLTRYGNSGAYTNHDSPAFKRFYTPIETTASQPASTPSIPTQFPAGFQDYLNRLTMQAGNALNGGLLGYQPANLQAPNAGGTAAQYNAPTDLGLLGQYAQRPWMKG